MVNRLSSSTFLGAITSNPCIAGNSETPHKVPFEMSSTRMTKVSTRSRALPTGTLTFLFTDIEGSTSQWESDPVQMSAILKRHDAILRAVFKKHGGRVFKKMGDAFCAAFERVSSAALAAIEAQQRFAQQESAKLGPLSVRIALHTGEAEERDDDYFGPALNRIARLLSVGYGQQILLSSTTAHLIRSDPSQSFEVRSLGSYRLRDLAQPEEIFQLCDAGLRDQFPHLRSLDAAPNNLPSRLTSFVGREEVIGNLKQLLETSRLLTLVGPGGVGKTRLAVELAAGLVAEYSDGVWMVELATIAEPELVESTIASTLNLRSAAGRPSNASLETRLADKQLLLVLDNCEHLIDTAADQLNRILKSCPNIRCIATSREPLRISGESIHRVDSLPVPEGSENVTAQEAQAYGAIRLFCERAREASGRFALTDRNAPIVTEICRRLDGIPLAIELTAAQLRVLNVEHVNQRLKERLPLVVGANRAALPRHMTIESLIDWSYGLLRNAEKSLFPRVAIFSGTFSLDAAGAVCSDDTIDTSATLGILSSLVEQSLLFADITGGNERYRLLETTREFALAKLRGSEEFTPIVHRHATFFREVVRQADADFHVVPHEVWLNRLRLELDNIRSLLSWALGECGNSVLGAEVVGWLDRFWFEAGLTQEAQRWIDRAMNLIDERSNAIVVGRLWLARSFCLTGDDKVLAAERSRALYESIGDDRGLAYALRELGGALRLVGRAGEARRVLARAASLLTKTDDAGALSLTLSALGALHAYSREFDEAHGIYSKALNVAREAGAQYALMMGYLHLADLYFLSGDCESAVAHAIEALDLAQATMNSRFYANIKYNLAAYRIGLGQLDLAREDARDALRVLRRNQDSPQVANVVLHLAFLAASTGDANTAARLVGYSDAYLKAHGIEREPTENWVRERTMAVIEQRLPQKTIGTLDHLGSLMTEEQAIREALGSEPEATGQEPT